MPSGHSFGYAGFQQSSENPFQGRVVFSIWDQGGCDQDVNSNCPADQLAQTTQCGTGIQCTGFGGEGTGRKSIVYDNFLHFFPFVLTRVLPGSLSCAHRGGSPVLGDVTRHVR